MEFDESLMERYRRLQQDLARAYRDLPWQSNQIDRIADELQATEQALAQQSPARPPPPGTHKFNAWSHYQ